MKTIPLSRGMVALVDDVDYEILSRVNWYASRDGSTFYALRADQKNLVRHKVIMHRVILGVPRGAMTDHVDGNGLNNQRANLRICTNSQNQANRRLGTNNTTGFRGVFFLHGRYVARIGFNKKPIHIGMADTIEEAARMYDAKAFELFGEFARLNFPNEKPILPAPKRKGKKK